MVQPQENNNNRAAAYYMLVAIISYSLAPLVMDLNNGSETPFMFNAGWKIGGLLFCLSYLVTAHSSLLFNKKIIKHVWHQAFSVLMLIAIISGFDYSLFAWSTRFVDTSVAAILYETWPMITILIIARLFKHEQRYQKITGTRFVFLVLGFVGIAFVIASETGGFHKLHIELKPTLVFGVMLAASAALVTALAGALFKWSTDLKQTLTDSGIKYPADSLVLFCIVAGTIICYLPATLISTIAGHVRGEEITLPMMAVNVAGGVLINGFGIVCWRKANLMTSNLGINAMAYFVPVLTLLWLWLFSSIDLVAPDYLIIGLTAIVAANLITNIEADIRLGYKSLMTALWLCGLIVYFQGDRYFWAAEFYFEAIAVSSTLFILILSFRISRFVTRTTDEEKYTLSIIHAVRSCKWLDEKKMINCILRVEAPKDPEDLKHAYEEAKESIKKAQSELSDKQRSESVQAVSKIEAELDILAHSKQQGENVGELFALFIFALISISIALFSRPIDVSDTAGFFLDIFSFLFSAVTIFLIFNVLDLHRDRALPILTELGDSYRIVFRDATNRQFELYLSGMICLGIIIAYAVLLWK